MKSKSLTYNNSVHESAVTVCAHLNSANMTLTAALAHYNAGFGGSADKKKLCRILSLISELEINVYTTLDEQRAAHRMLEEQHRAAQILEKERVENERR